ncbi:MAG TPA: cadherin-like domain-containing protein, partial [Thermoguttaceae bacterium]|nr:cadherin-like domain-containing protein [Thermoguttaceae bacterium]
VTATPETLLLTERISDTGDLTVGSHSVSITPDFSSAAEDYFLVAVLDDGSEVVETNESDNERTFDGGTFFAVDGTVHVHGPDSDAADTVDASLSSTLDVTLNGTTHSFAPGDVATIELRTHGGNDTITWHEITSPLSGSKDLIVFGGAQSGGRDVAHLYGSAGHHDELRAYPTYATMTTTLDSATLTIDVQGVEETRGYSGAGNDDLAVLYGVDGAADELTSKPEEGYTELRPADGGAYFLRAQGFQIVWGVGYEDDGDLAIMEGTSGDDTIECKLYEGRTTFRVLAGLNGYRTNAWKFREYSVDGKDGFDTAWIFGGDSWPDPTISGDDTLTITPRYNGSVLTLDAEISTSSKPVVASAHGFEEVHGRVKGLDGGRGDDLATVYGTGQDDELEMEIDSKTRILKMPQNCSVDLKGFNDVVVSADPGGHDRIYADLADGACTLEQVSGEHAVRFSGGVGIADELVGFEYVEGNPAGTGSEVRLALDPIDDQIRFEDTPAPDVDVPVAQAGPTISGGAVSYNSNESLLTATLLDPTTAPKVHFDLNDDQFGDAIITAESNYSDGTKIFNSFNLAIEAVNDPPEMEVNAGLTVAEGDTQAITTLELSAWDVDDDLAALTYTVTSGCSQGRLELSTNPGVAISSFTQADLAAGEVQYVHDGSEPVAESFQFDLQDDDLAGPNGLTFAITVMPVNDPPQVTNGALAVDYRSVKGTVVGQVAAENPESEQALYYEITGGDPNGVLAIDGETGLITVAEGSLLVFEEARGYTLSVTVTDDGEPPASGTGTVDVTLTSTPWVQDPIADHDFPAEQTELRIRLADVFFEPDDQSQLTYGFANDNGVLFSVAKEGEGDDRELVVTRLSDDSGTALITV